VRFTDLSGDSVAARLWDFGDHGTSTERDPAHVYASAGTYTVTLTVTRAGGAVESETKADYVVVGPSPYDVTPGEGSIGTQIRITGAGFGDAGGKVHLRRTGSTGRTRGSALEVLSWDDGVIVARVRSAVDAALHDVTIRPKGLGAVVVGNAFTVAAPVVESVAPASGSPRDAFTVTGDCFGTQRGTVRLRCVVGGRTRSRRCKVAAWTMDATTGASSATVTVPVGLPPGVHDLVVASRIGSTVAQACFTVVQ
jgi:PKD repeat protein